MTSKDRKLYYFHIRHDWSEIGPDCPVTYVNADNEWQAIAGTLDGLPIPDKMYNDSILPRDETSQEGGVITPERLIAAFTFQPYLHEEVRRQLRSQIRVWNFVPPHKQIAFLRQLMEHFATLPCFSNNDQILLKLASRGTKLVSCESQALHQEFVRYGREWNRKRFLRNLFQRNEFMATQIDFSLRPGETGVLFLGHLHGTDNDMLKRLLKKRIVVEEMNQCRALE